MCASKFYNACYLLIECARHCHHKVISFRIYKDNELIITKRKGLPYAWIVNDQRLSLNTTILMLQLKIWSFFKTVMKVIRYLGLDDEYSVRVCHFSLKWCFYKLYFIVRKYCACFWNIKPELNILFEEYSKQQRQVWTTYGSFP